MKGIRWLPVVALTAVVLLTASLGAWQLRRAAEKESLQAGLEEARALPAARLAGASPDLVAQAGRRVLLEGRLDTQASIFLDNRTRAGVAGFHVLTPLQLEPGGGWVMVLRGWVPVDRIDRTRLPVLKVFSDPVTIEGGVEAVLAQPMQLARAAEPGPQDRLWQHYEPETYRRWSGHPVKDGIVRQTSALPDGLARDWPEPGRGADKHRAYAFQWFAMAALAAAGTLLLALRIVRPRAQKPD